MLNFNRLQDCVVTNKNVILRVDINVPVKNGVIQDDTRIRAVIPTIKYLIENQAKVILISHFDRPEGQRVPSMSLKQLVGKIEELLGKKIKFVDDCIGEEVEKAVAKTGYGEVILLENLRFYKGETKNDPEFSRALANVGNLYVNDAFSCSHRAHASIVGITGILKSCAGLLLENEIENLQNLVANPAKPLMAIVGGSKVSTKIDLLNALMKKANAIFIAGGMANTFLYALGNNVGKSLYEKELKSLALEILINAGANNCQIILPKDVVVCKKLESGTEVRNVDIADVKDDDIIADIGQKTISDLEKEIQNFKTVVWNGPLGAFEIKPFDQATTNLAKIIVKRTAEKNLISVAGGGDVVSALNACNAVDGFSYISTAGGAFLEWLEGKSLPGLLAIENKKIYVI
ncbi:MAG: phosphoglycerate kinase [Rickettsiaceae bacterium]|jgi:phosphoglycerate kinase|nr:phosphoglycerate kinase [Rickettsiaceae bacterium]